MRLNYLLIAWGFIGFLIASDVARFDERHCPEKSSNLEIATVIAIWPIIVPVAFLAGLLGREAPKKCTLNEGVYP